MITSRAITPLIISVAVTSASLSARAFQPHAGWRELQAARWLVDRMLVHESSNRVLHRLKLRTEGRQFGGHDSRRVSGPPERDRTRPRLQGRLRGQLRRRPRLLQETAAPLSRGRRDPHPPKNPHHRILSAGAPARRALSHRERRDQARGWISYDPRSWVTRTPAPLDKGSTDFPVSP